MANDQPEGGVVQERILDPLEGGRDRGLEPVDDSEDRALNRRPHIEDDRAEGLTVVPGVDQPSHQRGDGDHHEADGVSRERCIEQPLAGSPHLGRYRHNALDGCPGCGGCIDSPNHDNEPADNSGQRQHQIAVLADPRRKSSQYSSNGSNGRQECGAELGSSVLPLCICDALGIGGLVGRVFEVALSLGRLLHQQGVAGLDLLGLG